MFEFLTTNPAVALLKEDHDRVKELFDRFEAAKTRPFASRWAKRS